MDLSWQIRTRIRFFAIAAILGIVVGMVVLFPLNEFVIFREYGAPGFRSGTAFATTQLREALKGARPRKTAFYSALGMILSVAAAAVYARLAARERQIMNLHSALQDDLRMLIAEGESSNLEFKSSFRWDLKDQKVNRALENVILKTLAGYMNAAGGTLLIGVADDGAIVGLESDYKTLKKPDRDGFEQALMTSIATKLGGDACHSVQALFQSVGEKDVCRVITAPGHRPIYLRDGETPRLYVRTGVSTRELNLQEAVNYIQVRWRRK